MKKVILVLRANAWWLWWVFILLALGAQMAKCAEPKKGKVKKTEPAPVVQLTPEQRVMEIKTKTLVRLAELEAAKQIAEAEYRLAQAEIAVREMRNPKSPAQEPPDPAPIGTAAVNSAVTTVTYRDATGVAVEASDRWAKHTEKLADIDRKKAVGVAKAENPGCGWTCMLLNPTPWPVGYGGYYGGGSGYYGGGTAYVGGGYGPRPTTFHYSR